MADPVTIIGIGTCYVQFTEYVTSDVLYDYGQQMGTLKTLLDSTQAPSAAEYDSLMNAINALKDLAMNGKVETSGGNQYNSYITPQMATSINQVMLSLQTAGIPPATTPTPQQKIDLLTTWQSLSSYGVETILTNALIVVQQATQTVDPKVIDPATGQPMVVAIPIGRSLQSMVELEYVKAGNDLIFNQLTNMQNALSITQGIIGTLTSLKNISNLIRVSLPSTPYSIPSAGTLVSVTYWSTVTLFPLHQVQVTKMVPMGNVDPDTFKKFYEKSASAYFSQLFPTALPTGTTAADLFHTKMLLSAQLTALQLSNPAQQITSKSALASYIHQVIADISAQFSAIGIPAHLAGIGYSGTLQSLLQSNPSLFATTFKSAAVSWILDGSHSILAADRNSKAGNIQNDLGLAISNAQNLNDNQKDTVQRYLYIFQQFYKSASAILQAIENAIEKFTKGIHDQ